VDVVGRSVECDASEDGGGFYLRDINGSARSKDASEEFEYPLGGRGNFREIESSDVGHF
jgi:hypothetical protein